MNTLTKILKKGTQQ